MYNSSGTIKEKGGSYLKTSRNTTYEERLAIVEYCFEHENDYASTASSFDVSYQQVRNWVIRFTKLGAAGLEDRRGRRKINQNPRNELEALEIRLKQLEHENQLLSIENKLLKDAQKITSIRSDFLFIFINFVNYSN